MKYYLYLMAGCLAVTAGCSNSSSGDKADGIAAPVAAQAPRIQAPFTYHKTIEVAPGIYYDVLGWGRGSETVGAFEILRSDSASMKYTTTTGDLEGRIVDVYNSDMDTDGNPEIFIHTQTADSTNAAQVFAFEYNDDKARKLDFPRLTRSQRKGYRGNDNFFIKEGNLMREFDVYDEEDTLAKKPVQKRLIQYNLRGNTLYSDQISKDSTSKSKEIATALQPAGKPEAQNTPRKSSVSKRSSKQRSSSPKRHSSRKKETKAKRRRHR